LSYGGKEINFFALVWPQLVSPNPEMKKRAEGIHEFLGNTLFFLIGAHALAALWQHYAAGRFTSSYVQSS